MFQITPLPTSSRLGQISRSGHDWEVEVGKNEVFLPRRRATNLRSSRAIPIRSNCSVIFRDCTVSATWRRSHCDTWLGRAPYCQNKINCSTVRVRGNSIIPEITPTNTEPMDHRVQRSVKRWWSRVDCQAKDVKMSMTSCDVLPLKPKTLLCYCDEP